MGLATPQSAILSAVIFNALIIVALIPLALRGVGFRPAPASVLLQRNLLIYGLGGIIAPFIGIKADRPRRVRPPPRIGHRSMTTFLRHRLWPAIALLVALTLDHRRRLSRSSSPRSPRSPSRTRPTARSSSRPTAGPSARA